MTLSVSNSPMRVLLSSGVAGPQGVSVTSAAVDSAGRLVITLTSGETLAPIDLSLAVMQAGQQVAAAVTTLSGAVETALDGTVVTRIL